MLPPPSCHHGIFLVGLPGGIQPLECERMCKLEATALAGVLSVTLVIPDGVCSHLCELERSQGECNSPQHSGRVILP